MARSIAEKSGARNQPMGPTDSALAPVNASRSESSFVMKLSPQAVEQTLSQFEAQAVPNSHPAMA
jgi:hypothetical protein